MQPGVGHYGVFNGSRFRSEIAPRIGDFVLSNNGAGRGDRPAARSGAPASAKSNGAMSAAASDASTLADAAE
jgi:poly(3-hydroxybutyrate) depolymerase